MLFQIKEVSVLETYSIPAKQATSFVQQSLIDMNTFLIYLTKNITTRILTFSLKILMELVFLPIIWMYSTFKYHPYS